MTNGMVSKMDEILFKNDVYTKSAIEKMFPDSESKTFPNGNIRFEHEGKKYYFKPTETPDEFQYVGQW